MSFAGTPTSSQDVTGIFDAQFNQLFPDARAVRALVKREAKAAEHPLESGQPITDNIIFLPNEIELSMILTPATLASTYQQVIAAWQAGTIFTIQTKVGTFASMYILKPPHDEVPEMFDTIALAMTCREAQFVDAQFAQLPASSVRKPANASTVATGQKTGQDANSSQSSAAFDLIFGSKP